MNPGRTGDSSAIKRIPRELINPNPRIDAFAAARRSNRVAARGELIRITSSVSVMVASIAPLSLNNLAIRLRLDFSPSFLNLAAPAINSFAFLMEVSER